MSLDLTAWEVDRVLGLLDDVNRCADALERIAVALETRGAEYPPASPYAFGAQVRTHGGMTYTVVGWKHSRLYGEWVLEVQSPFGQGTLRLSEVVRAADEQA